MDITEAMALKGARIQILIQEDTPMGAYHDALYFQPKEIDALKEEDITAQVQTRVTNWMAFVQEQSSKPPVVPTKEELKESAEVQVAQLEAVTAKFIDSAPSKEEAQKLIDSLQKQLDDLKAATGDVKAAEPVGEVIIP